MNRFFSTLLLCVATALCVAGANPPAGGLPCLWHFDKARHAAHAATFVDEGYLTADGRPGATLRYLRADGNAPGGFVRTLGKSHNPAVRGGAAGDCWLFAVPVDSLGRGERIGIDFLFGNDASAPKYYRLEYFERGRWLPAAQLRRAAEDPDVRYTHRLFASGKGNSYKVFGTIRLRDALVRDTLRIRWVQAADLRADDGRPIPSDSIGTSGFCNAHGWAPASAGWAPARSPARGASSSSATATRITTSCRGSSANWPPSKGATCASRCSPSAAARWSATSNRPTAAI